MINRKGQALVEFVLILPVFLLLLFSFIDVGRIILCKTELENTMNEVVLLVNEDKSLTEIKNNLDSDVSITVDHNSNIDITLTRSLELITPIMNRVLSNPYNVKVERSIFDE